MYELCNAYDTYLAYQCYKCQAFGHSAINCKNTQVCANCGGDHKFKDCHSDIDKCKDCEKRVIRTLSINHWISRRDL